MGVPANWRTPLPFDHRASIVAYLDQLAGRTELTGQRDAATNLRAAASTIAACLDITPGYSGTITPIQAIVKETVAALGEGVSAAEVLGPSRGTNAVSRARFAAMWVASKRLAWSEDRLGEGFGRDRTTVAHGLVRAAEIRGDDPEFRVATDILAQCDISCPHCLVDLT